MPAPAFCRHALLAASLGLLIPMPSAQADTTRFTYWDDPSASAISLRRDQFVAQARQREGLARLRFVNRVVNNAARQRFEEEDVWKGFDRLVRDGFGDCEDFAIAKYQILIEAGTPSARLDFLAAEDTLTPTYHAVLRYREDDGSHLILDNLTPMMLPQRQRTDLTPLVTFDRERATYFHDGTFHAVAPARIELGGERLAQRMPHLLDY
ncbi:transglutaminase-like cysteine peptidase [Salinicola avicenniae]|uniref:transglutaminase-like cysteine peptidase n=1 Tax=Salinicola avicenniae TaxID=2916836 RepID=UPI002073359E|nr:MULTISPECIES: transglutaminase-like cysteine peptidase [unclassified Salinicola]